MLTHKSWLYFVQVVALDVMAPLASRRMTTVPCPRARPGEPSGPLMASSRATSARNAIAVSDCERAIRQKCASTVQLLDGGDVLGLESLLCGERTRKMANRGLNMDEMADTIAVSISAVPVRTTVAGQRPPFPALDFWIKFATRSANEVCLWRHALVDSGRLAEHNSRGFSWPMPLTWSTSGLDEPIRLTRRG